MSHLSHSSTELSDLCTGISESSSMSYIAASSILSNTISTSDGPDGCVVSKNKVSYMKPIQSVASGEKEEERFHISNNTVVVLTGATAAGKSALAMKLCERIHAEIIIADSVQVYKYLDIGSNKPSYDDQTSVKHHLVDLLDPHDPTPYSAGDFAREASDIIKDAISRGKMPVVVGGSTMWVDWLVHGLPDNPKATKDVYEKIQELLSPFEKDKLWDEAIDKFGARNKEKLRSLTRNDWYRLSRALEISVAEIGLDKFIELSNSSEESSKISESSLIASALSSESSNEIPTPKLRQTLLEGYDVRGIFLSDDRDYLYHKIDARCLTMIEQGLLEEVTDLMLKHNLNPESMGAAAIGYKQTIAYLCRSNFERNDRKAFLEYLL